MRSYLDTEYEYEYLSGYDRWALFSLNIWGCLEVNIHLPLDHTNARLAFQRGYNE